MSDIYNYDNWRSFKAAFGLTNKDIAEITGTSLDNINHQARPAKKLPTWARAMLYVWYKSKEV